MLIGLLCIFEGCASYFLPVQKSGYPVSSNMIWEQPKGTRLDHGVQISINKYGLRGSKPKIPKPKHKRRLMSVGDSSIFGFLVEERDVFTSVATRSLPNWEPINGGCPGYSSEQSLLWVKQFVPFFEIDLLVVGNLWSDSTNMGFRDRDLFQRSPQPIHTFLSQSQLYRLLFYWFSNIPQKLSWDDRQKQDGSNRVSPIEYRENLIAMIEIMKQGKGDVLFVALATQEEVEQGHIDTKGEIYRKIMRDVAHQNNSIVIEAKEIWEVHQSTNLFADFIHPNAKGHQFLGEELKKYLH